MKSKVGILSLGCPRNLVDSEVILGRLKIKGFRVVDISKADIGIINTCGFIEDAKKESIDAIIELLDLKKKGRLKKVIVAGCLVQRYGKELLSGFGNEIDAFIGSLDVKNIPASRFSLTPPHTAYLKISEGCVNNCSYCAIPGIKGPLSSRKRSSIIEEVRLLDSRMVRELNVIGQDITGYGTDIYGKPSLPALLKDIRRQLRNIRWVRLLYLHPKRVNDELLDIIGFSKEFCKYIDLPIQHINDRILGLMNRGMRRRDIEAVIDKVRKRIPGVALRTSLITGFPSETAAEFKEMLDFITDVKFERLGVFAFSREEGTKAYGLSGRIAKKESQRRRSVLMSRQREISDKINLSLLNCRIEVMIDEEDPSSEGMYFGRSRSDAPEVDGMVYLHSARKLKPGDIVRSRVIDTLEYDLVAEVDEGSGGINIDKK